MRTERKHVTGSGLGMTDTLAMTETLGKESGLSRKENLQLRLLAEELCGLLRGIAGDVEAAYWLDIDKKKFEIHMESEIELTDEMRKQILSASSSGENDAEKGFMGKLRVMIAETLLTKAARSSMKSGLSLGFMGMSSPSAQGAGASAYQWSMKKYKEEAAARNNEGWDGLERSIVANIADDVSVRIVGDNVHIIVYKQF